MSEMPTREMIKCEGCGDYHSLDECETVIIRIVKGKNCELKSPGRSVGQDFKMPGATVVVPQKEDVIVPNNNVEVAQSTVPVVPQKIKNIVPPAIASMMLDPGSPGFDTYGAKETRRV